MNPTAPAAPTAQAALQLRDIHLPAAPGFWPLAPGWWVVAALLCLLTVVGAVAAWRRFQRRAREAQALQTLARLEQAFRHDRAPETLAHISVLLRQIALARFPRREVASLTGRAWLGFLDASGGQGRFATGPGQVLAGSPYQRSLPAELDMDALMALVREWVQVNLRENRMTFQLAWPWLLAALPLPLLALWLPAAPQAPRVGLRFPFPGALAPMSARRPGTRHPVRLWLAALAWVLLVLAAARPQQVGDTVRVPVAGRNIMLAVDLSGSMQTPDMQSGDRMVSRLAAVKKVAGDFIARRVGDRLGLILFGDEAYLQTPMTLDRRTVLTLLGEAQIGLAGQQTAIGDAIGLGIKRLRDEPAGNRVLILLTDGASNAGSVAPLKAADLAAQEGVRVYTIGVGADPSASAGPFGLVQAGDSDLDEGTLQAIAQKTGGRYFRASDVAALTQIYGLIDKIEPVAKDAQSWRPVDELYFWPLGLALALSAAMALTAPGRFGSLRFTRTRHA